jgi:hypothetical protein
MSSRTSVIRIIVFVVMLAATGAMLRTGVAQKASTPMEAEFDRLDKSKNGELDVKELTQSRLLVSHFTSVGK